MRAAPSPARSGPSDSPVSRLAVDPPPPAASPLPVRITYELAAMVGVIERVRVIDAISGVVDLTEAELLALGASRVEWGKPDERGHYTPTLYADAPAPLP